MRRHRDTKTAENTGNLRIAALPAQFRGAHTEVEKGDGHVYFEFLLDPRWFIAYAVAMPGDFSARASVGNQCYHVLNRGNARQQIFFKDGDYYAFMKIVAMPASRSPCACLGLVPDAQSFSSHSLAS